MNQQLFSVFPQSLAPFVGRVKELETLEQFLLNPEIQLITIVGPGGIGKTRLAIEGAKRVSTFFSESAYLIELIEFTSCDQIVDYLIEHLPFKHDASLPPVERLIQALIDKEVLLVLDNFEHLLDCAGLVLELVEACPTLKILATSREPLNLQAEWVLQLGGMTLPPDIVRDVEAKDYEAVQLFALRAQQANQRFSLDEQAADVARICQLVEGMPLAIELAAAWLRTLSAHEIAAEIQHSLNILSSKYHDVEDRHRSIEAIFEHSWKLLTAEEKSIFARLTIFRGGFTRDAARIVADVDLGALDKLIDKSLVHRQHEDRYAIHELLRHYGEGKLEQDPGEYQSVLKQCATYYARFLHRHEKHLETLRGGLHLDQLIQEINNIQRALKYLLSRDRVSDISDTIVSLIFLYQQAGWLREGYQDFTRLEEQFRQHSPSITRDLALARALIGLAYWQHALDQHTQAIERLEEALTLLRENPEATAIDVGLGLLFLARAARAVGDYDQAQESFIAAIQQFEKESWSQGIWLTVGYQAELVLELGKVEDARSGWQNALDISIQTDYVDGQIVSLANIALAEIQLGLLNDSRHHLLKAVKLCQEHLVVFPIPITFAASLTLLAQHRKWEIVSDIAQLVQARTTTDFQVKRYIQSVLDAAPKHLNLQGSSQSPTRERRYVLDTIIQDDLLKLEDVLQELPDLTRPALTDREQEVLRLLARGNTNLQIAQKLDIAEGTVKRYTHHLFKKLAVQNRAQAVHKANEWQLL